jgi:putative hydrolase of the HAD superfamily
VSGLERTAKPPAAIGFDLGETLLTYAETPLSWADLYAEALGHVAVRCEINLQARAITDAVAVLARHNTRLHPRREEISARAIFSRILALWELPVKHHLDSTLETFFGFFQQRLHVYPETEEVLTVVRDRGLRVGVLTDVPYGMPREFVERDLAGAKLSGLVDVLLTSVEVGWRKPEPVGFQTLAHKLQVAAVDLWFVGNEQKDIAGARAVGATTVLIDRDGHAPTWGQHYTVRNLHEIIALI